MPAGTELGIEQGLLLAVILFVIGIVGLIIRRNILFMLMAMEIMLNAAALAFITAGSYWHNVDGQVMFIMIITLAAAEVGIALALLIQLHRRNPELDIDQLAQMKG